MYLVLVFVIIYYTPGIPLFYISVFPFLFGPFLFIVLLTIFIYFYLSSIRSPLYFSILLLLVLVSRRRLFVPAKKCVINICNTQDKCYYYYTYAPVFMPLQLCYPFQLSPEKKSTSFYPLRIQLSISKKVLVFTIVCIDNRINKKKYNAHGLTCIFKMTE